MCPGRCASGSDHAELLAELDQHRNGVSVLPPTGFSVGIESVATTVRCRTLRSVVQATGGGQDGKSAGVMPSALEPVVHVSVIDPTAHPDIDLADSRKKTSSGQKERPGNCLQDRERPSKRSLTRGTKSGERQPDVSECNGDNGSSPVAGRKRKATNSLSILQPLLSRNEHTNLWLGAHVSAAKGVENSVFAARHIGANAFALFVKNQRRWEAPDLGEANVAAFIAACSEHRYEPARILPHGSYLVNLAQQDPDTWSHHVKAFTNELQRCERLGIQFLNIHPGTCSLKEEGVKSIAKGILEGLQRTQSIRVVLETMCGSSNSLGGFENIAAIRQLVCAADTPDIHYGNRVMVCLDTCHVFAAGHDLRTQKSYEATWEEFDRVIGLENLAGIHLNDSKAPLNSKRDLHANIGTGYLGLEAFRLIVNDPRLHRKPIILETPQDDLQIWADEIALLYSLVGKGANDPKLLEVAEKLQLHGADARKHQWTLRKATREKEKAR